MNTESDYYAALQQIGLNLQQNVNLPNNVQAQIQASSVVGEIYRYQVVGPPHIGLTNLRTIQDWVLQRRLLTVPGVVQVNTWGGTTKEYEVEADLNKLEAYGVTLQQLVSAISNANINIGGRNIDIGKQSVSIRGIGLIDTGGSEDVIQGRRVEDIESITLSQTNGVPVQIRDVARVLRRECAPARQGGPGRERRCRRRHCRHEQDTPYERRHRLPKGRGR